jgi:hypothetical protein
VIGGVASNRAANKAADASQRAIDANAYQGQIATDQYDDYRDTYRPLEHALVQSAQHFDTPQAYEQAAAKAQAAVSSQIGLARDRLARTPGLDPSSPAAQAAYTNLALHGAAIGATQQNQAREQVRDKAFAHQLDIAGLGRGLVANASTGFANAAASASNIAHNNALEANQSASGAGAAVGAMINAIGKANWGNLGLGGANGYNNWQANNAGMLNGSGLSGADLITAA